MGEGVQLVGGDLNAALARAVVGAYRTQVGRGPTKARAFFRGEVVVVVLQSTLTHAESTLVRAGEGASVTESRSLLQAGMRDQLVASVESLTGRQVVAFLSSNDIEADYSSELFVLDGHVPSASAEDQPPPL
ncbi:MAG: hypothetical protein QOJ97_1277 [Solirubrobacteraceae bacterium]|jgi:uncharacterized protein YbcI|nr:hypothetical protein [Solirubrobacteraceae bacterium]